MSITLSRIEKAQEELFSRLEDDLSIANNSDYYLTGKDVYYYTVALKNLEDLKKTAINDHECGLPFVTVQ